MAKKHLALLIPHTDVMLESDFRAALPEEWVCHACRMYLEEVGEEAEKRMVDEGGALCAENPAGDRPL